MDAAYYQSLIGILRCIVELGRVDICTEVSLLSSCLALPRSRHQEQVFRVFAYLKKHHNTEMVFNPSYPEINQNHFERQDWYHTVYGDSLTEYLPPNIPEPQGLAFALSAYVDSDRAGNTITRRSRTVYWMLNKQNSIETSSSGSEFCAMKVATEYTRGLRFKLRMMGIPCTEPAYICGGNQSVLANTTMPYSVLKKNSKYIAFYFVREGSAKDEWSTANVNTNETQRI